MAVSDVSIANLALQKLGAARITSLTEDSRNARSINNCYELVRDRELRAHKWNFAVKRTTLAPDATAPDFDFGYAFTLPSDCLRILPPSRHGLDWKIENHGGSAAILTNDGDTLEILYISSVEDPTVFDPLFVDAFAAKLAWHICEELTQSNQKKADAFNEYKMAIREARQANAFENISEDAPEDPWLAVRR
ncbi:hypothetical protein [Nitrosovibrio sp. Nv4]|uniref:hypothetical protein n=1 Tax=Nitrosovibrio sp. Nv4 TaxID=1945880 RepID=UPI000BD7A76C|nr:hypothetical protein [Nitrosovibrio sp. Nv4]SOD41316.1 hypothetical protein SAMN06298226_1611 [Nitrosovibrio sp. Nv4]